jgi:hypothetical protein
MRLAATLVMCGMLAGSVSASQPPPPPSNADARPREADAPRPSNPPPPAPSTASGEIYTRPPALSSNEFMLSVMVLILGSLALGLAFILLRSRNIDADDMIRLISVILILTGTMFLITAGFDSQQIAPAMGLFGTIAGYLLGKSAGVEIGKQQERSGAREEADK